MSATTFRIASIQDGVYHRSSYVCLGMGVTYSWGWGLRRGPLGTGTISHGRSELSQAGSSWWTRSTLLMGRLSQHGCKGNEGWPLSTGGCHLGRQVRWVGDNPGQLLQAAWNQWVGCKWAASSCMWESQSIQCSSLWQYLPFLPTGDIINAKYVFHHWTMVLILKLWSGITVRGRTGLRRICHATYRQQLLIL